LLKIELSKKTGAPLGVLPGKVKKEKVYTDNLGVARTKQETPDEKRDRKKSIREQRKMHRNKKREILKKHINQKKKFC